MKRRRFLKSASGLFVPLAFPAISRAVQITNQVIYANTCKVNNLNPGKVSNAGLNTSLVAYWRMEETNQSIRGDATGNGHDLTYGQSVAAMSGGVCANCGDSVGGTLALGTNGSGTFFANIQPGDSFTIQAWCNFNAIPASGYHGVVSLWDTSVISYFTWFQNPTPGKLWLTVSNAAGTQQPDRLIVDTPSINAWHHLIFGYDAANTQTFWQWDNGARSTNACTGIYKSAGNVDFHLFNYAGDTSPCDMLQDEVGWWRRVLTTAEVTALYGGGSGLCWPFT